MIDTQLLDGVLLALVIVVGAAITLSLAMIAAATLSRPGQPPRGGTRREVPRRPVPDDDYLPRVPRPDDDYLPRMPVPDDDYLPWVPVPDGDRARELVLR
jgi:hypothetical protein